MVGRADGFGVKLARYCPGELRDLLLALDLAGRNGGDNQISLACLPPGADYDTEVRGGVLVASPGPVLAMSVILNRNTEFLFEGIEIVPKTRHVRGVEKLQERDF